MKIALFSLAAVAIGFVLDLIIGDPHFLPHPVRLMGHLITFLEKILRRIFKKTPSGELWGGALLVFIMLALSTGVPFAILFFAYRLSPYVYLAAESVMCYQMLAAKSLKVESTRVYKALKTQGLEQAREKVSMIVGRDAERLDEAGVTGATVETVAENTTDGVVAPLLYMLLGGAVLGFLYKAVNTMDSMIGYKNEKYLYFGRTAAKTDDVFNFVPARISALLMVLSAAVLGLNAKNAWRVFRRDRKKHASPNSAQTESVCAGALGVRLAGDAYYGGILHKKEFIGDPLREIEYDDIKRANRLMYLTAFLCLVLFGALKAGLIFILWCL